MATKTKESTLMKEKKGTSSSISQANNSTKTMKQSKAAGPSAKETSTGSKKPLPNYLKPTLSSIHDPLKQVKKHGPEDSSNKPNPIRRRSFDRPPSTSRVQNPHISPGPRERSIVKSSTSSAKISTVPKPSSEKTSTISSKGTKVQSHPAKVVKSNNLASKKGPTTAWVPRKYATHPSPDSAETSPKSEIKKEEKESLVDEIENEVEVANYDVDNHDEVAKDGPKIEEHEDVKSNENTNTSEYLTTATAVHSEETRVQENEAKADNLVVEAEDCKKGVSSGIHQEEDSEVEAVKASEYKVEDGADIPENVDLGTKIDNENKLEPNAENDDQVEYEEGEKWDSAEEEQKSEEATNVPKRPAGEKNKDSPAYNDVIEETASKLMKKRQNKVLALAGAFQSVIDYETSSK